MSKKRLTVSAKNKKPKTTKVEKPVEKSKVSKEKVTRTISGIKTSLKRVLEGITYKKMVGGVTPEQKVILAGILNLFGEENNSHHNAIMIGMMSAVLAVDNEYWID